MPARSLGILTALLAVTPLAGCATTTERAELEARINVEPTSYKADIIAFLRTYLNDPTQIREAGISEPMLKTVGTQNRYVVCLRYNAKTSLGRHAGARDRMAVFASGRFDRIVENAREQCKDVALAPFPELERLTR
jgi:hypothetical protein